VKKTGGRLVPTGQGLGEERCVSCQIPTRQKSGEERGGRLVPTGQGPGEERGVSSQIPTRQGYGEERGGRSVPTGQELGVEREGKLRGLMVDSQMQTMRLGGSRTRSRGRRPDRSPTRTPGPILPISRTYAAVAAQVTPARVPTPASWPNRVPLGPNPRPATKLDPGMFWLQLVFPGIDDGSRSTK
jgi:hypothetical protein